MKTVADKTKTREGSNFFRQPHQSGLTIIELLIAMMILGILIIWMS